MHYVIDAILLGMIIGSVVCLIKEKSEARERHERIEARLEKLEKKNPP